MRLVRVGDKGFTITELMISMTILAIGLLAVAQMQIVALQGTRAARRFSVAAKLANEPLEAAKVPGMFLWSSGDSSFANLDSRIYNYTVLNDADADFAPTITRDDDIEDILSTHNYDILYVIRENTSTNTFDDVCGGYQPYPASCPAVPDMDDDLGPDGYVRIVNIRNTPPGRFLDGINPVSKEMNVIVLWKEGNMTRSVNVRTIVARKDYDFF